MAIIDKIQLSGTVYTIGNETTTAVTSASTDNEIPTAKAVYNAIPQGGGGKAVTGGTNISVTTGETADTINCTLPITISNSDNGSKQSIAIGSGSSAHISNWYDSIVIGKNSKGYFGSVVIGSNPTPYSTSNGSNVAIGNETKFYDNSIIIGNYAQGYNGYGANSIAIGVSARANNIKGAVAIGYDAYTNSTMKTNINNQLKIDTSNQIYIKDKTNTNEICLQDYLGGGGSSYTAGDGIDITNDVISVSGVVMSSAITTSVTSSSTDVQVPSAKAVNDKLGGLSIVKLTQAEYDALATKDSNVLYVIVG